MGGIARCCPHCNGTGYVSEAEPVEITADLERACVERGIWVSPDGRVREADAADLIGMAAKTLRNWRYVDRRLPFVTRSGRPLYALADLADFTSDAQK